MDNKAKLLVTDFAILRSQVPSFINNQIIYYLVHTKHLI
jgi:hypothetical protein